MKKLEALLTNVIYLLGSVLFVVVALLVALTPLIVGVLGVMALMKYISS